MNSTIIIRLEANQFAAQEDVVSQFNSYMQQTCPSMSFVQANEGYFRLSCDEKAGISSAGVLELGRFLQSTGYTVTAIHGASAGESALSTEVKFEKDGKEGSILLSTLRVY